MAMEKRARFHSTWLPYALILPQIALTLVFFVWPAGQAVYQSVYIQDAFGGNLQFVGLDNFRDLWNDEHYLASFQVTAVFSSLVAFFGLSISLVLAVFADRLVLQMGRLEREELWVVLLNTKNVVLRVVPVYRGNVSASLVRVGELFRDAVRLGASGLILAHNHPSGDPTPSPDDLHLTAEALAAGRLLDIELLDHLVVGHDAWVSLRDRGVAFDRIGPSVAGIG